MSEIKNEMRQTTSQIGENRYYGPPIAKRNQEPKIMKKSNFAVITLLLFILASTTVLAQDIYIVRHAEKQTDKNGDPSLTQQGHERARWLARFFSDKQLEQIFSTDYKRTRLTALPTANSYQLDIQIYDPNKPEALVKQVLKSGKSTLIVGHSNTVPHLVKLFKGEATDDIEHEEYDRLYWITATDGEVKTRLLNSETLAKK